MSERTSTSRPPRVLIVSDQDWSASSLQSILWPSGYYVLRERVGSKAPDRVRAAKPDVVFVDANLSDPDGITVCRTLRLEQHVADSTPILMTSVDQPSRQLRLAALEAGAWEFISHPIDQKELLARIHVYVQAKFESDRARDNSMLDGESGLYNLRGLERRARELAAQAFRNHRALACLVIAPELADNGFGDGPSDGIMKDIADVLKTTARTSDTVGQLGDTEFAILAPDTNAPGAVRLAERIVQAVAELELAAEIRFRAGYEAVWDYYQRPIDPVDFLLQATEALRKARREEEEDRWIWAFEDDFQPGQAPQAWTTPQSMLEHGRRRRPTPTPH
jgi:diguanylate cyclase (GGDEF)-like protein